MTQSNRSYSRYKRLLASYGMTARYTSREAKETDSTEINSTEKTELEIPTRQRRPRKRKHSVIESPREEELDDEFEPIEQQNVYIGEMRPTRSTWYRYRQCSGKVSDSSNMRIRHGITCVSGLETASLIQSSKDVEKFVTPTYLKPWLREGLNDQS